MINKSTLAKKLSSYSALASVIILAGEGITIPEMANAQSKGTILTAGQNCYLDLENIVFAGEEQFNLGVPYHLYRGSVSASQTYDEHIIPYRMASVNASSLNFPPPLNAGDIIGKDLKWKFRYQTNTRSIYNDFDLSRHREFEGYSSFKSSTIGLWHDVRHKYIGLKINNGTDGSFYGWARLSVAPDTLIVESYDLSNFPDSSIIAGEGDTLTNPILVADKKVVCRGDTAILHIRNPDPNAYYFWYKNGQQIGIDDTALIVYNTGYYFVTETYDFNHFVLSNSYSFAIDTIGVSIIYDSNYGLEANSKIVGNLLFPPFTYTWYLNGSQITKPNSQGLTYEPDSSGIYEVAITDNLGCTFLSPPYDFIFTGVSPLPDNNAKIYSANNTLHVQLLSTSMLNGQLTIFNDLGQSVLEQIITSGDFTLNLNQLQRGVYIVRLEKNGNQVIRKIIVD